MRVKDLASLAGTTVRTVRYYHHLGLLAVPEGGTGWRSYGFAHVTRLMRIRWLVESGVPLAEVPHLLRPAEHTDERDGAVDDLQGVLASIDERLAVLTRQRARVELLMRRVAEEGRLTPLPQAVERLYDELLSRPLPEGTLETMRRERDLLELACYRQALPADLLQVLEAMTPEHVDRLVALWQEAYHVDQVAGPQLTGAQRSLLDEVAAATVTLVEQIEPAAGRRLLARAGLLEHPAVRTAVDLAYASPAYRHLIGAVVARSRGRGAA